LGIAANPRICEKRESLTVRRRAVVAWGAVAVTLGIGLILARKYVSFYHYTVAK
jgi:hypothetical protein